MSPRRSESERQTTHQSGSESSLEDYFVYYHTDNWEHCSSSSLKGPNVICINRHGWRGLQLVYGVVGQNERPVDEVQEGLVEAIQVWLNLGIIFLPTRADNTTVCLTSIS